MYEVIELILNQTKRCYDIVNDEFKEEAISSY